MDVVGRDTLRDRFAALLAGGAGLGRAALEIACIGYPDLDVDPWLGRLDTLADGVQRTLGSGAPPAERLTALTRHLFVDCRFHGNTADYYDPRNSYLNDVLARRTGIPISLSVVFMEVAARVGLGVEGIGFPGHFIVRALLPRGPVLLDPYSGGQPLTEAELVERLTRFGGAPITQVPPRLLEPVDTPAILARMLANLLRVHSGRGDHARALATVELALVIEPDDAEHLRTRGMLYERLDCAAAAAADFQRCLEVAPEGPGTAEIRQRLGRLSRGRPTLH